MICHILNYLRKSIIMLPIITGIFSLASTWLEGRNKKSAAKAEAEATALMKAAEHESQWENLMAKGSDTSWKDEYWTIVLSIPLVLCFFPEYNQYVINGFEALSKTPEWYQYLLMAAIAASFGLRGLSKFKK